MTHNFDRWLAERLENELPDSRTIRAEPSEARYRASRAVRRGLPRLLRALVPSVAAQFVLAGTTVAVAVAAGATATGHMPRSFIPAVGAASSITAPTQDLGSGAGASTVANQATGHASSPKQGSSQAAPIVKKEVANRPEAPEPKNTERARDEHRSPDPRPSSTPEPRHSDNPSRPAPSPSPDPEPPHNEH